MEPGPHFAHASVGRLTAARDDPGVVSRSHDHVDIATGPSRRPIRTLSAWRDTDAGFGNVYRGAHTTVMAQRRERFDGAHQALWWIPAGTIPSIEDGLAALWRIDRFGPGAGASTSTCRFSAGGHPGPQADNRPDSWCVGHA